MGVLPFMEFVSIDFIGECLETKWMWSDFSLMLFSNGNKLICTVITHLDEFVFSNSVIHSILFSSNLFICTIESETLIWHWQWQVIELWHLVITSDPAFLFVYSRRVNFQFVIKPVKMTLLTRYWNNSFASIILNVTFHWIEFALQLRYKSFEIKSF